MTVVYETRIKRFIGLSTDTKPTAALGDVPDGSYFWAWDTGTLFKTHDGTNWIAYSVNSVVQPGTVDLHNGAGARDLFTATGGSVLVEYFTLTLPAVSVADDVGGITGISVQTDTTAVIILVPAANALVAALTPSKVYTYATPFTLPVGKKIQLTIVGGTADADPTTCITSCRYRAINPAGYLA
jgi:hypothetical protein